MSRERKRFLAPRPKGVRCVSDPFRAHGDGHNRVCVCLCSWCVAERAASAGIDAVVAADAAPQGDAMQFSLSLEAA